METWFSVTERWCLSQILVWQGPEKIDFVCWSIPTIISSNISDTKSYTEVWARKRLCTCSLGDEYLVRAYTVDIGKLKTAFCKIWSAFDAAILVGSCSAIAVCTICLFRDAAVQLLVWHAWQPASGQLYSVQRKTVLLEYWRKCQVFLWCLSIRT